MAPRRPPGSKVARRPAACVPSPTISVDDSDGSDDGSSSSNSSGETLGTNVVNSSGETEALPVLPARAEAPRGSASSDDPTSVVAKPDQEEAVDVIFDGGSSGAAGGVTSSKAKRGRPPRQQETTRRRFNKKTTTSTMPWARNNLKQKYRNREIAAKIKQAKADGLLPKARKGYVIFVSEKKPKPGTGGALWKELSAEDKAEYNRRSIEEFEALRVAK